MGRADSPCRNREKSREREDRCRELLKESVTAAEGRSCGRRLDRRTSGANGLGFQPRLWIPGYQSTPSASLTLPAVPSLRLTRGDFRGTAAALRSRLPAADEYRRPPPLQHGPRCRHERARLQSAPLPREARGGAAILPPGRCEASSRRAESEALSGTARSSITGGAGVQKPFLPAGGTRYEGDRDSGRDHGGRTG